MSIDLVEFYTGEEKKRIPNITLKETMENKKWFLIGINAADENKKTNKMKFPSLKNIRLRYLV